MGKFIANAPNWTTGAGTADGIVLTTQNFMGIQGGTTMGLRAFH